MYIYIYIYIYIIYIYHISSFGQIVQWLQRVHGKHEVVGSNITRANFLYGTEKPWFKMNTIYIGKFHYTPTINSQIKLERLVW